MAKVLMETLMTIEKYKNASPHYGELLEILGEILILREEYRRKIKKAIFTVDDNLVQKKLEGGLPLVDFTGGDIDLDDSEKYFHALLKRAEKRNPEETKEIREKFKKGEIVFADVVRDSFVAKPRQKSTDKDEENVFDLLSFLIEESLRPSLR